MARYINKGTNEKPDYELDAEASTSRTLAKTEEKAVEAEPVNKKSTTDKGAK